ncbi:MAG: tyrosine protein phosphatase [Chloroflexi bacterium]|nr:tyrosine protein phosphatase [Chloroflexota bacterium]MCL5074365.1 tyrosine protein phosphatase [Chloroflexota bacterium]
MIDIHTHLLPGLDDGAETLEEALAMARTAQADGITQIVVTPHSSDWSYFSGRADVLSRLETLRAALTEEAIALDLSPGVEVHISPYILGWLQTGKVFPLNGSRYLLLEMPLFQYPSYSERVIFELQISGFVPIIAHPERNAIIQKDPNLLYHLVAKGALAQITAGSLSGHFGSQAREAAQVMLTHNLAHIIASDAHSMHTRPPVLSDGLRYATELISEEQAKAMVTSIPQAILNDEVPNLSVPIAYEPKKIWTAWR